MPFRSHSKGPVLSLNANAMCGRERVAERGTVFGGQHERKWYGATLVATDGGTVPQRQGSGGPLRAGGITELQGIAGPVHDLGVSQGDLARFTGIDGKHPRSDQPVTHQLDQGWVALLPHDLFVDRSGLVCVHRLATQFLVSLE